jgi:GNAT superfamily N-acetyltransferase
MSDAIRRLRHADIPAAMRLKEAAGWNQSEQDWATVLDLEPEGCFAIESGGELAATATAVCYGSELAWIGMVLTAPEFRGRGLARRLMEHALGFLREREVAWIKLDATDMGRPLYRKLGFEDECPIERWSGAGAQGGSGTRPTGFELDAALDRQAFGADRTKLLGRLAQGEAESIPGEGYAMGRPGTMGVYFGPAVARTTEAARTLLGSFLARHAGETVFWDLLPENHNARQLAQEFGFTPVRSLWRMSLAGASGHRPLAHDDSLVYAIAGFEVG